MQELPEPLLALLARAQNLIHQRPDEDPHQLELLIPQLKLLIQRFSVAHPATELFSDGG